MTTLTIRLPDDLRSELDKLSRDENKAVSDIVRESLRRYVAVERFRAIRRKILPFAEAQGLLTDDDVDFHGDAAGVMAMLSVSVMPMSWHCSNANICCFTLWSGQAG